jgi:hypothetical protein
MKRKIFGLATLGITLYWLASRCYLFTLALFVGLSIETVHQYLQFGISILPKALFEIPKTTLVFSFVIYF